MDEIEIKWCSNDDKKCLVADGITSKIVINEEAKEIENAKIFFREIIYLSFLNDWNKKIVLVEDTQNEVIEVKQIINELIQVCNSELDQK